MAPRDRICNYRTYGIYRNDKTTSVFAGTHYDFIDDIDGTRFVSTTVLITNDSTNTVEVSFDGVNVHGHVLGNETLTMDKRREQEIWLRSAAPALDNFRLWAW